MRLLFLPLRTKSYVSFSFINLVLLKAINVTLLCFLWILTDHISLFLSPAAPVEDGSEEEDVHCSKLIFREDFLSNQHFGENQHASIITEKVHFGEGMHRRAFRTKMQSGQIPLFLPGHPCVLKVHNAISYGTKNNDELIQKNFSLAVEVRASQQSFVVTCPSAKRWK